MTNAVVSTADDADVSDIVYAYDAAERLEGIVSHEGTKTQRFDYSYNPRNGMISGVENTNTGIRCSYGYDVMERVDRISYYKADGSLIRSVDYDYDSAGMITNKTISGGTTSVSSYTYDSINRLTSETRASSEPSVVNYSYDLAGNRLSKTNNSTVVNYTLGSGNRLASWSASDTNSLVTDVRGTSSETIGTDDRWGTLWVSNVTAQAGAKPQVDGSGFVADNLPMQAGTNQYVAAIRDDAGNMGYATNVVVYSVVTNGTFGYDNAGCITNISHSGTGGYSDNLSLEWDERYRLTSVSSATSVANYTYDVLGRRTSCSVGSASQTNTTYFIYNGNQVIADLDEDGDVLRTYVWGTGIDNLLSFTDHTTTNTYYPIKDIQNTVIALVDESGSVVETYDYDAWGRTKIFSASGSELTESLVGNRYMFQGREYDASTGLYYFRARWYSPETGRFISKDPIGISGGLNLYEFCGNNPVNFVDPDGEDWKTNARAAFEISTHLITQELPMKVDEFYQEGKAVAGSAIQVSKKYARQMRHMASRKEFYSKIYNSKVVKIGLGGVVMLVMEPTALGDPAGHVLEDGSIYWGDDVIYITNENGKLVAVPFSEPVYSCPE